MGARLLAALVVVTLLAACGGGGEDKADEPDCPTTTTGQQPSAVTTTVDPRCVQRATETSEPKRAESQTWNGVLDTTEGGPGMRGETKGTFTVTVGPDGAVTGTGTSHSTYSTAPPIDSQLTVTGTRDNSGFHLTIAANPGTGIDVNASIAGNVAVGPISLTGEAGAFSLGQVRLECQNCG